MADEYAIPSWLTAEGNMGKMYGDAALRSRAQRQSEANSTLERGIASSNEAMRAQEFNDKVSQVAAQRASQAQYQDALKKIVSDPKTYPPGTPQYQQAVIMAGLQSGMLSGAGMAAAIRGLTPTPQVTPGFSPIGGAPSSVPPPVPGNTAPQSAPLTPPAPASSESPWLQPPGVFTDAKGVQHFERGVPLPRTTPARPTVAKPGDVILDSALKPVYTNTFSKPIPLPKAQYVAPGGVLLDPTTRQPFYTNTNFRASSPAGSVPKIKTKAERDKLPDGTEYIGTDGKIYIKHDNE